MSIGTGVGMIMAGAILFWALEVDLPFVDVPALGMILIVAGIVGLAASFTTYAEELPSGARAGVAMLVVGAILFWAVDIDLPYVIDDALAVILMVAGLLAVVVTVAMDVQHARNRHSADQRFWRDPRDHH